MEINVDELVKQEIQKQVKQKVDNHFQNEIKKAITKSTIKNDVQRYIERHLGEIVELEDVVQRLDLKKIQEDIVTRVSYAIASKLDCDDYL